MLVVLLNSFITQSCELDIAVLIIERAVFCACLLSCRRPKHAITVILLLYTWVLLHLFWYFIVFNKQGHLERITGNGIETLRPLGCCLAFFTSPQLSLVSRLHGGCIQLNNGEVGTAQKD